MRDDAARKADWQAVGATLLFTIVQFGGFLLFQVTYPVAAWSDGLAPSLARTSASYAAMFSLWHASLVPLALLGMVVLLKRASESPYRWLQLGASLAAGSVFLAPGRIAATTLAWSLALQFTLLVLTGPTRKANKP